MKKSIALAAGVLVAFVLTAPESALTEEKPSHEMMHQMMMKQGGPKPDTRIELRLPDTMKVMQKGMMRKHLDTVGDITAALASNDLPMAARVAKENLGWNQAEAERCSMVEKMTGEKGFLDLGKAVHLKADELAEAAASGNRDKALEHLSQLIKNCNACHATYRH